LATNSSRMEGLTGLQKAREKEGSDVSFDSGGAPSRVTYD
jgi:hypothetical protein